MKKTRQTVYVLVALCYGALHGMDPMKKSDDILVQHMQKILVSVPDSDQMAYINSHNLLQKEAGAGHATAVEFLIKHGATIDGYDAEGKTALHQAAYNGHLDVVKILVRYKELLLYQQNRLAIRQQIDGIACALASALHERLGIQSPLAMLGQPLVYEISRMVAEEIKKDQSQNRSTGPKNKKICAVKTCVVQ